jgi:hypothetical protein
MAECCVCGKKAGIFSAVSLNGRVCKECLSYLPKGLNIRAAEKEYLNDIISENRRLAEIFEGTSHYGCLYIDQTHGLICISDKGKQETPLSFGNIFGLKDIKEMGLFLCDVRNAGQNTNRILGNVKFRIKTDTIHTEFVIAKGKECPFKIKGDKVEYEEPRELTVFRVLINQMIENECLALIKKLEKLHELDSELKKHDERTKWAKGVLFLGRDEQADLPTVKARRNFLIRKFHPDYNEDTEYNEEISAYLNEAYEILKE